ncbi:MAG: hypothetical protein ACRDN9_08475 [Streptosporangiaceae bacterium]
MADGRFERPDSEKRGGYSGSKPGTEMRPPVKTPSGFGDSSNSDDE